MPVSREDLTAALRRLIVAHPDMVETRSRAAKAAYLRALDEFWTFWAQRT